MAGEGWLFAALAAPFLAAMAAPLAVRLAGAGAAWLLALAPFAAFAVFAGLVAPVSGGAAIRVGVDWLPAFGVRLSLLVDGLSLLFALLITGIGGLIVIYAGSYLAGHRQLGRFLAFLFLFMGAMLGLVLADDLVALFVFWEMTSVASFLLIGFDHARERARRAALQALVVTGAGGLALLAAVLMIGAATGERSMTGLLAGGDALRQSAQYVPILLLVLLAAFTKSAQFPLHVWLPNAMEAPTPVSAYLHSATMVKAGVYLLMRLNPALGDTPLWTTILPAVGGVTLLAGALLAMRQTDMKQMLAYTTMASLGLLVMLVGAGGELALKGAVAYLFAHALFKGGLFMVVGTVDHETGTRDAAHLSGLRRAMPVTFAAAVLGALSMAGLPPLSGFVAKEALYGGLLDTTALIAVAVVGNALMFAVAATVVLRPFTGALRPMPKAPHEGPPGLWLGPLLLGLLGLGAALGTEWWDAALVAPATAVVAGRPVAEALHLVPSFFSPPLLLSLLTIGLGIVALLMLPRLRDGVSTMLRIARWGPDRGFDDFVAGLVALARSITRVAQPGAMSVYVTLTFLAALLALGLPMLVVERWPNLPAMPSPRFHEALVIAAAVAGVLAVLAARSRLAAILSLGVLGWAVALLFMLFGAADLAFTQVMVETLSVVILALVMTRLGLSVRDERRPFERAVFGALAVLFGAGVGVVLFAVTAVPLDSGISDFYGGYSYLAAHGRNVVNVVIVDFRGLDTLGEIAVVMIAGLSILAMLRLRNRQRVTPGNAPREAA